MKDPEPRFGIVVCPAVNAPNGICGLHLGHRRETRQRVGGASMLIADGGGAWTLYVESR